MTAQTSLSVANNLAAIRAEVPDNVTLVAVSKTRPNEDILAARAAGQLDFGENKVQEMVAKAETLPRTIRWHMIGNLQSNKVKFIAPFVTLIHSVSSSSLLQEINKQAAKNARTIDCLLQVKIAQEDSKSGFSEQDVINLIETQEFKNFRYVRIVGLMGMATHTEDINQIRLEFRSISELMQRLRAGSFAQRAEFSILSMGMTDDFGIAIEEGSNMIRIGSAIFGARH